MSSGISRRELIATGAAIAGRAMAAPQPDDSVSPAKQKVAIFSQHLQFVPTEELAQAAASLGFDGVDLTVRKGGHVTPERVRQDLPGLVSIIRRHGLETPMITTDIVDATTLHAADILGVMQDLGIRYYRWGGFR